MIALGLREQMTEDGVNVSVVLPGYIDTDISVPLRAPEGAAGTDRRTVRRLVGGHADDLAGPVRGDGPKQVGGNMLRLLDEANRHGGRAGRVRRGPRCRAVSSGSGGRNTQPERIVTRPVDPSTSTRAPSGMRRVADGTPAAQGTPSSRLTIIA